jgi:glycosyltransferase involved in cell wall biosynthesis
LYEFEDEKHDEIKTHLGFRGLLKKLQWRWHRHRASKYFGNNLHFMDRSVLLRSFKELGRNHYDLFIGIEKEGLIWAGLMGKHFHTPFLYYSLELYLEDHPMMEHVGHLRESERFFHRKAAATIIQDEFRAKALRAANGANGKEIFIPVAVRGPRNQNRTRFLANRFGFEDETKILLFFGGMLEGRMCDTIIEAADYLPKEFVLVFHGFAQDKDYLENLQELAKGRPVFFSDADLNEGELDSLLSSADIGFALYRNDNVNDRLTAYSSQKIALFCRNGIPFISNRNESYEALFKSFQCGEMASTSREIANAAIRIAENIEDYRKQCFLAFDEIYDFDKQFDVLKHYLEKFKK